MPTPCERPPIKPSDLEEPPIVCGEGLGGAGGSGSGEKRKSPDVTAKHPSYVLEFRSVIVSTDRDSEPAQSQASASIRLEADGEGASAVQPKYSGQGTIAYQTGPLPNWNPRDPLIRGQGTVPLRVFQAFIHVEERPTGTAAYRGSPAKIELLYGILGGTRETNTGMPFYLEGNCVANKPQWHPFWSTMYISGRGEVATMPEQMFLLKDWTYVGQDGVVATKTLRSTCGGMCDQEVATFTLREGERAEPSPPK